MNSALTRHLLISTTCLLVVMQAMAQVPDPTRPADAAVAMSEAGNSSSQGLQAIIVRKGKGKHATAIIAGQTVRVGDQIGEKRVMSITENTVSLQNAQGRETLQLLPAAKKTLASPSRAVRYRASRPKGTTQK